MMATTQVGPLAAPRAATGPADTRRRLRPMAVGAGVGAAVVAWTVITRVGGVDLRAPVFGGSASGSAVGLGQVVAASGLASLAAWGVLAVLRRRTRHARPAWLATAVLVFLLSLGGPLSGTG